jgi:hypothetical protein
VARAGGVKEERRSFLKKRTKKLLPFGVRRRIGPRQHRKSLLLLFFRKEDLPYLIDCNHKHWTP